jgi:NAD(P)-dependent dehydrogenase (short-subunit alcohol dehydrogenase family)
VTTGVLAVHASYPDLVGKVVVVTGGSKGIGRAISEAFVVNHARTYVIARSDETALDSSIAALRSHARQPVAGHLADLTDSEEVNRVFKAIRMEAGRIDVLVNNAGGFNAMTSLTDISDVEWTNMIDKNVTSAFYCCRACLPTMVAQGQGCIVSIGSEAGRNPPWITGAHYATAKAALSGMTRHIAKEYGPFGIRANIIVPGGTVTDRYVRLGLTSPEALARAAIDIPLGRHSSPSEQASAVLFLASSAASYINGVALTVNGGRNMRE